MSRATSVHIYSHFDARPSSRNAGHKQSPADANSARAPTKTVREIATEMLARDHAFQSGALGPERTRLEELRRELRKQRRRKWLRWVTGGHLFDGNRTAEKDSSYSRSWHRDAASVRFGWKAAAILVLVSLPLLHVTRPAATEFVARQIFTHIPNSAIAEIEAAEACTKAHPILDASGTLSGISPEKACAGSQKYLSSPVPANAARNMRIALEAVEGSYHTGWQTILGLNWHGWIRAVAHSVHITDAGTGGGSDPLETAIKNLRQHPGRLSLWEKFRSGFHTVTFVARELPDERRDAFAIENFPCTRSLSGSAFGPSLAGGLCPNYLFAKDPGSLTWAEFCFWASTGTPQYLITGAGADAEQAEIARTAESRIRERAKTCIARIAGGLGWSSRDVTDWEARVDALELPADRRKQDSVPESVDPGVTLPGLGYVLSDELRLTDRPDSAIRLNVSGLAQREAYARAIDALKKAERRLAPGLCLVTCGANLKPADYLGVIAEIDGPNLRIRDAVSSGHFLLAGPMKAVQNGYIRTPSTRGEGSTNKAWIAVKSVAAGIHILCNDFPVGISKPIQKYGPPPCADGRGLVDLNEAVARSLNGAFGDAVAKLGVAPMKDYFRAIGFTFEDAGLTDREWTDGLVLGFRVTAAPVILLRNMAALYRGANGEEPESSLPAVLADSPPVAPFNWRSVGLTPEKLREAATYLSRPITAANGTLVALRPVLARHGCAGPVVGKTGTSESTATDTAVRDKLVLAGFTCGSRRFVVFGLIGSPAIDVDLGTGIRAADVVSLLDALLPPANKEASLR